MPLPTSFPFPSRIPLTALLQGILESIARIEAQAYRLLAEQGATPVTRVLTAGAAFKGAAAECLLAWHGRPAASAARCTVVVGAGFSKGWRRSRG